MVKKKQSWWGKECFCGIDVVFYCAMVFVATSVTYLIVLPSNEDFNQAMTKLAPEWCKGQRYETKEFNQELYEFCILVREKERCNREVPSYPKYVYTNFTTGIWLEDEEVVVCKDESKCDFSKEGGGCGVPQQTFTLDEVLSQ